MGFEDETPNTTDEIEAANLYAQKKRLEAEKARAETLLKSQQNQEEYEAKQRKLKELAEVLGVAEMRTKIDQQDESLTYLAGRMDEIIKALNNSMAQLQNNTPQQIPAQMTAAGNAQLDRISQLEGIGAIVERLATTWKSLKGESAPAMQPLISQDIINEKMTKAFFDDLETGESIRKFISDTLKKKATQAIVKQSLGNMGQIEHTPE